MESTQLNLNDNITSENIIVSITPDLNLDEEIIVNPNKINRQTVVLPNMNDLPHMTDRPTRLVDDILPIDVIPKLENIKSYVKPLVDSTVEKEQLEKEMLSSVMGFIHLMESVKRTDACYSALVYNTFVSFKYLLRGVDFMRDNLSFLVLVKAIFHRYIVTLQHTELIPIYNDIFNDNFYSAEYSKYVFFPALSEKWKEDRIEEYQQQCREISIKRRSKRDPPKYQIDEIIGAKDKENKWWMSKVLACFAHENHIIYYVEFLGWGERFNEFIVDGFRMQKFNPKKHRYFRPAWTKKTAEDNLVEDNLVEDNLDELTQLDVNATPQ